MAEAIAGALLRAGVSQAARMRISDPSPERRGHLRETYDIITTTDNAEVFNHSDIVILAVKPQIMAEVLEQLSGEAKAAPRRKLVISIAAGFPIRKIEQFLYAGCDEPAMARMPVVRVMPNTPALVLAGMSGLSANRQATEADITLARTVLAATGQVLVFPESALNAVTAVSGSGPAYVFYLVEAMIDAGVSLGLGQDEAAVLTRQTLKGALALLEESAAEPGELRRRVTSPGGTTEAALSVMEDRRVRQSIMAAMTAACQRAAELSD